MEAEERSSLPQTGVESVAEGHRAQWWQMCSQAVVMSPKPVYPEQNMLRVPRVLVGHSLAVSPPSTSMLSQLGLSGSHGMRIYPSETQPCERRRVNHQPFVGGPQCTPPRQNGGSLDPEWRQGYMEPIWPSSHALNPLWRGVLRVIGNRGPESSSGKPMVATTCSSPACLPCC